MRRLPSGVELRIERLPHEAPLDVGRLPAEDLGRMAAFSSVARRRSFALGRTTMRSLLADRLGSDPTNTALRVAADGALHCASDGLYISLTHTATAAEAVAVAAVADRPVGVDAEAVRPRHPRLHRRFLQEEEYGLIEEVAQDTDQAIVILWAVKEAVLKGRRSGLRCRMTQLLIRAERDQAAVVEAPDGELWEATWFIAHGCAVAVALLRRPAVP